MQSLHWLQPTAASPCQPQAWPPYYLHVPLHTRRTAPRPTSPSSMVHGRRLPAPTLWPPGATPAHAHLLACPHLATPLDCQINTP
eukprot:XP_001701564.1 predicted protein [Chlamydomonas reinhardtii]